MSAAYFRIANGTPSPDTLVTVETAIASAIELHETIEREPGVRGMRPVGRIPVSPGEVVALAPGGLHVMLIRLTRPLVEGDTLPLTLRFASGEAIDALMAPVRTAPPTSER